MIGLADPKSELLEIFKTFVECIQYLSVIVANLHLPWPEFLLDLYEQIVTFLLVNFDVLVPECLVDLPYSTKYAVVACFPLYVAVLVAITIAIKYGFSRIIDIKNPRGICCIGSSKNVKDPDLYPFSAVWYAYTVFFIETFLTAYLSSLMTPLELEQLTFESKEVLNVLQFIAVALLVVFTIYLMIQFWVLPHLPPFNEHKYLDFIFGDHEYREDLEVLNRNTLLNNLIAQELEALKQIKQSCFGSPEGHQDRCCCIFQLSVCMLCFWWMMIPPLFMAIPAIGTVVVFNMFIACLTSCRAWVSFNVLFSLVLVFLTRADSHTAAIGLLTLSVFRIFFVLGINVNKAYGWLSNYDNFSFSKHFPVAPFGNKTFENPRIVNLMLMFSSFVVLIHAVIGFHNERTGTTELSLGITALVFSGIFTLISLVAAIHALKHKIISSNSRIARVLRQCFRLHEKERENAYEMK